jgi:FKBP-type peptidyl-prolyl cis-trans isomerase SlyD
MWVRVDFRAFDKDGEAIEAGATSASYVHGFGALLPPLEAALEGQPEGAERSVTLSAREAFGPRRDDAVVEFAREDFPASVAAGDRFEAENAEGRPVLLQILEVTPDSVVVDLNHPLAGQRVRFDFRIAQVRPATPEEIAAAERTLEDLPAEGPVIPVERLLQGPSQRYEMGPSSSAADGADDET